MSATLPCVNMKLTTHFTNFTGLLTYWYLPCRATYYRRFPSEVRGMKKIRKENCQCCLSTTPLQMIHFLLMSLGFFGSFIFKFSSKFYSSVLFYARRLFMASYADDKGKNRKKNLIIKQPWYTNAFGSMLPSYPGWRISRWRWWRFPSWRVVFRQHLLIGCRTFRTTSAWATSITWASAFTWAARGGRDVLSPTRVVPFGDVYINHS